MDDRQLEKALAARAWCWIAGLLVLDLVALGLLALAGCWLWRLLGGLAWLLY